MADRLVHRLRLVGAIIMIALYAYCAALSPATATMIHCSSHPCHDVMQKGQHDPGGRHIHDGVTSMRDMAKADHGGEGKAKTDAGSGCQFSCATVLSPNAAPVMARRIEAMVTFGALGREPEGMSPERLIRPPKSPLA